MTLLARISVDPAVRLGTPCVRGTRLTVGDVLGVLAGGASQEELLECFPELSRDDELACFAFAAARERSILVARPS